MNVYFSEIQEKIMSSQLDILDVFNRYIGGTFDRKGFCRCPFHSEKTPSFKLFRNNKSFYCFGCGAGGNIINLVSKALNINYLEAMKRLDEDYSLGLFEKQIKTDTRRSKEAIETARKQLKNQQLQIKRRNNYFKLIDYFKELQEMPLNQAVSHDLAFIERLLDKWLLYENEPFDGIPADFNADVLIYALKSKFTNREEAKNGERN